MKPIVTIESFLKKKGSLHLLTDVDLLEATQPVNDNNGTYVRVCVIMIVYCYFFCHLCFAARMNNGNRIKRNAQQKI